MPQFESYCAFAATLPADHPHRRYHDQAYGFPLADEAELFGRLILEINQAGLSWDTILRKADNFRAAYSGFDPAAVAAYGEADRQRLLADPGIIRNRLKIEAAIHNAQVLLKLRASHGGFHAWLAAHHPRDKAAWVKLFKSTFRFTGGEITGEFLMSTGWLPGAHVPGCPAGEAAVAAGAPWVTGGCGP